MSRRGRIAIVTLGAALFVGQAVAKVDVVCVYYPHWHRYPKGTEWFGKDWNEGEWNFVRTAVPRYPGHLQPMKPFPGYLNGSDPADVETEIELASNAGIDVFLYDYYYYGGKVTQEEALEQGFLKARNRGKMKFALMWCYHERRDQFRPPVGQKDRRMLMELDHTPDEFLGLVDLSIGRYFNRPEYWRKDGKLFLSIFNVAYFVENLGEDGVRRAVQEARRRVAEAGLGELHLNAQGVGRGGQGMAQRIGFDSVTHYNIAPDETPSCLTDYGSMARNSRRVWAENARGPLPYIPVVSTGWDRSPRCELSARLPWASTEYPYGSIVTNATSANFEALLRDARAYAENDPKKCGAVLVNAWNEYTECPGLLPTVRELDFRLRALARVFGRKPADRFVTCAMKKFWKKDAANGRAIDIEMPTFENVKYGSHERQGMDVWLPARSGGKPVPCVVYVHGGAWMDGNRIDANTIDWLRLCREEGCALVAITYRMISDAMDAGIRPPVKAPVDDARAAVEYVRAHAAEWGIDPSAIGLAGGSAGACSSLIVAFRDGNPLRIKALHVSSPQTSIDPAEMREWVPNIRYGAHAFGFKDFESWLESRNRIVPFINVYSPAALARKIAVADAPVVFYTCGAQPKPGELAKDPTHAPQFCARFAEICHSRGIPCARGGKADFIRTLNEKTRRIK